MWLFISFSISLTLNILGWAISVAAETEKLYDLTGSLSFILVNLLSFVAAHDPGARSDARSVLALVTLLLWAARLGAFLFTRVLGRPDRRLTKYVKDPVSFLVLWVAQACWVFFSSLPVLALFALEGARAPYGSTWDMAATAVCLASAVLQVVADEEKRAFRAVPRNRGAFIQTGLWAWSRHPNYFFQILFAWALSAVAWPAVRVAAGFWGALLCCLGPALETYLLLYVSGIPLLEQAGNDKWGDDARYRKYKESTPVLVPFAPAFRGRK
jgi:steroid 5-alpha reductase family enzyme